MIRYNAEEAAFYREKLVKRVQADIRDCYQCGNCSAGCPAAFTFDYTPNQIMRMLQVGLVDRVLESRALQLCLQCLTCSARCPRNIDIAGIIEDLKTVAFAQERDVPEHVKTFNNAFLNAVARFGRLPEFFMMALFYTGTMNPKMVLGDIGLVPPMITKGKLKFIPKRVPGAGEVSRIYKKAIEQAKAREKAEQSARRAAAATAMSGSSQSAEQTATVAAAAGSEVAP
ncbi:MAG: 4Fe-4S dicluster domain-containing protein [Thermoleophilia bacterium]|nr:4Fe-4S dicluster domain-containing protein [Thermoleophilia bacterium]